MTEMRNSLIVCFIGCLTLVCAHYPSVGYQRPHHHSIFYPRPSLYPSLYFRRPLFNIYPRFYPRVGIPHSPRRMFHPTPKVHASCATEQNFGGRTVVPTKAAKASSYDRKNTQIEPVQPSAFENVYPAVESQPVNLVQDIAHTAPATPFILNSKPSLAPEVKPSHDKHSGSESGHLFGVKPTLRLERTNSSNDTSSDPRNPDWNYFDFITNKDFILKLIENKLIKLQNKEKVVGGISVNTQLYDQIKRIEDAMGITVALDNVTTTVPPVSTNTPGNRTSKYCVMLSCVTKHVSYSIY